ncbi:MAG: tRNA (guanosine(46)-N7)-methyltransferase TrmB, partial [Lachnospiraceae bacterium]|nr:tRNA (guanosine(46)-N7)-methyltransferase TrmB [Lachnospiraceae bacterium]
REYDWDLLKDHRVNWQEAFGNDRPLRIEIGMGKGKFLAGMAARDQDINFVGIEKFSSVLIRAVQRIGRMEEEGTDLSNVRLIRADAERIEDIFEERSVDRIFLNFSDPWPKDRHAKRRLTSEQFLKRYERILKKDGDIVFKTDNRVFFDFSLEEIERSGWIIEEMTYDLGDSDPDNITTEYEDRFRSEGVKICRVIAKRP